MDQTNVGTAVSTELENGGGVYQIDPLRDARWAEFVSRHPRSSVFHTTAWLTTLHSTYGYEPTVFCTSPPGERLTGGLVVCRIKSWLTGSRIVSLPFSDHCEPLVDTDEERDAIFRAVKATVGNGCNYAEFRPVGQISGQSDLAGFRSYYWHSLDLSPSSDVLLKSFHKDCVQRKIRRADREALEYQEGNSAELLPKFYRMLTMARRRHSLPPPPYAWFQHLARAFGSDLKVRVASYEGRPVASILTLKHGKTITYKYGGSDARFNRFGGMALLLWQTILDAKTEGMTLLDFGRADIDNVGLITYKEHWNARRLVLTYLKFPSRPDRKLPRFPGAVAGAVARHAPEWSLVLAGKLIYPHIG